jgi:hypothetical protein
MAEYTALMGLKICGNQLNAEKELIYFLYSFIISYSKKVKEHSVQQAQFLSSNHCVVLSWRTQALAFIELQVDNVNRQGFNVSLAVLQFVRILMWPKC